MMRSLYFTEQRAVRRVLSQWRTQITERRKVNPISTSQRRTVSWQSEHAVSGAKAKLHIKSKFKSEAEHRQWLSQHAQLPQGFQVGTTNFGFTPEEAPEIDAKMRLTVLLLDEPSESYSLMFTNNAICGAPITIGREMRDTGAPLTGVVINNKISNVCARGGVQISNRIRQRAGEIFNVRPEGILPSSTGVIGWKLPVEKILECLPQVTETLQSDSILPAAEGICTTDLYPKVRSVEIAGGRIVGIAKGAGMIEPNLATMLVYILTDLDAPREKLDEWTRQAVDRTFNCMSIDSDQSTSDTMAVISSQALPLPEEHYAEFAAGLQDVCAKLSEDVVRNGEGVEHVMKVNITGAKTKDQARAVGKCIVNSPLIKCAVCGNDPNVGRIAAAIGSYIGKTDLGASLAGLQLSMGGHKIYEHEEFKLDGEMEQVLSQYMVDASMCPEEDSFPRHERTVDIDVELGLGDAEITVYGADLTHGYVSENADYRT